MKINAELIAIGILGVSLASLGWKVSSDIRHELKHELKQEIHHVREDVAHVREDVAHVREDVAGVRGDVADLRERMLRLEGLFEGFTRGELIKGKK